MTYFSFTRRSSTLPLQTYVTQCFGNTLAHAGQASPRRRTPDGTSLPLPLLRYAHSPRGHSQLGLVPGATPGSVGPAEHTGGRPRKDNLANGPTVHITRCLHHSMGAPGKAGLYVLVVYLPTFSNINSKFYFCMSIDIPLISVLMSIYMENLLKIRHDLNASK